MALRGGLAGQPRTIAAKKYAEVIKSIKSAINLHGGCASAPAMSNPEIQSRGT
jgi:hypothetical protein